MQAVSRRINLGGRRRQSQRSRVSVYESLIGQTTSHQWRNYGFTSSTRANSRIGTSHFQNVVSYPIYVCRPSLREAEWKFFQYLHLLLPTHICFVIVIAKYSGPANVPIDYCCCELR